MTGIAKYFAEVGIKVDNSQLRKVDLYLQALETKLTKYKGKANGFSLGISSFTVDQKKLDVALGTALDVASKTVSFEVSRFVVNHRNLQAALGGASRRAGVLGSTGGFGQPPLSASEWTSRRRVTQAEAALRHERALELAEIRGAGRIGGGRSSRSAAVAGGGIAGGISRLYGPAIALGLGGYGLSNLNQRNQAVVAAQLQTQAVSTGNGGTAEQGEQSFDWLRKTANRVGFNYLDASGDFNVLTSNLLGSGGTVAQSQNIFKGFAEYGRVNKLTPAKQKLVFNALSQIAGKDKLQAEELTKQLGNSLPGAKSIFAEAWQKKTGGNLTGSKAIQALEAAMKKGEVRGDILNYAADIASERSQSGLEKASQASQAEQGRFQNSVSDLAIVASNAGVEEGFARIFRTLRQGLEESNDLVETLSRGFNQATQVWSELFLIPQDIQRMFDGKDSVVADWLWGKGKQGEDTLANMIEIRNLFTNIKDLGKLAYDGWKQLFDMMDGSNSLSLLGDMLPSVNKALTGILELKKTGDAKTFAKTETDALTGLVDSYTWLPRKALSLITGPDEPSGGADRPSLRGLLNNFGVNGLGSSDWMNSRPALVEAQETLTRNQMNKAFDDPYYATAGIGDPFGLTGIRYNNKVNADEIGSKFRDTLTTQSTVSNNYYLDIKFEGVTANNGTIDFEAGGKTVAQWFKNEVETAALNFPNNQ